MKLAIVLLLAGVFLVHRAESQLLPLPKPLETVVKIAAKPLTFTVKLLTEQFNNFKSKFGKKYATPEEEKKRLEIFSVNYEKINQLTQIANLPFLAKVNQFCDLISAEFNKLLNGLKIKAYFRVNRPVKKYVPKNEPVVDQFDWRDKGVVTSVKNQGECASCYAFASAAAVESHIAIKTKKLQDISPQEVLDCSLVEPYENYGCDGGSLEPAYDYIKDKGLVTDVSYPYTAETGDKCQAKTENVAANIQSYVTIEEGDENALKEALHNIGPIAVGMDASSENWQFYGGGIYYEKDCKSSIEYLNHAVLLVGYGEEKGQKYWIVKNSYGDEWGEKGYARISRNETNHCGIASYAVYPEM
ncbi:hypothetical protein PPYR_05122 [Photinus pyralis]|uniref:Peptidase C1A papain C-terminal domain-containing protein n=1 Tax=Photinus pyralis TaxID=7054 RepID=A0A1Y1KA44_PHOPY|nr:cathepsin L1-like [Photinus pyralis]XP_031334751.1 cathepsin L1-like [Photinus pyralis]KAB0802927.1 hypothetical protein PPYR_05113 [Photinus pyralis]KAB0802936.1 hypothetical protein PPYR_05122 [Photinus pyralis]